MSHMWGRPRAAFQKISPVGDLKKLGRGGWYVPVCAVCVLVVLIYKFMEHLILNGFDFLNCLAVFLYFLFDDHCF